MIISIRTRKLQPSDTRGERVRAVGAGRSVTVPWDYGLSTEAMHAYAARRLAQNIVESCAAPEVRQIEATDAGYVFEVSG